LKMDREAIKEAREKKEKKKADARAKAESDGAETESTGTQVATTADEEDPERPPWKICDLKSFLADMAAEGRPAPPEAVVQKLENLLEDLKKVRSPLGLMTDEDVDRFVVKVGRNARM